MKVADQRTLNSVCGAALALLLAWASLACDGEADVPASTPDTREGLASETPLPEVAVPALPAGGQCPVSPDAPPIAGFSAVAGAGPVYSTTRGSISLVTMPPSQQPSIALKTAWVAVGYDGPFVVQARQVGTGAVLAVGGDTPGPSLRVGAGPTGYSGGGAAAGARFVVGAVVVPGPGCYVMQFDGVGFSNQVVFEVVP